MRAYSFSTGSENNPSGAENPATHPWLRDSQVMRYFLVFIGVVISGQAAYEYMTTSSRQICTGNRVIQSRGNTVEAISFEVPQAFVPDPIHIHILQAVSDRQGCHIGHVVQQLLATHGESGVRSGIRVLLSQRFLDGGKSSSEVVLRLTSKGRVLLQKAVADLPT